MSVYIATRGDRVPSHRPADLGWLLMIPLGCLLLGQLVLVSSGILPVLHGALADPDSYMRLNRVLHLHESGAWFDPTYPRINPPDGHVQHWTRALDALLLAGAWLLQPFLGFRGALHVWGVLFSPVCLALSIVALNWAAAPVLDRDTRLIACLLLLLQPTVIAYSSLGRADHHALLFLLFILLLGGTVRLLLEPSRRTALIAGASAALALWISPEALVFIGASLAALGLYWLIGEALLADRCRAFAGWTAAFLALALLAERGPTDLWVVENDRISILHVATFGLIALFWAGIVLIQSAARLGPATRVGAAALGLAALPLVLLVLFPELRHGPLGEVDPLYRTTRLERIVEIQPVVQPHLIAAGEYRAVAGRAIMILGIALLALPYLVRRWIDAGAEERRFWTVIAIATLAFLPLALHQVRWSSYAQILLLIPYAAMVQSLLGRLAARVPGSWLPIARPGTITLALFWPITATAALPPIEQVTANDLCSISELAPELNRLAGAKTKTILTLADFGSELLYRTPHSVLSIPNHRPQPGYTATHRALRATDPQAAQTILARHDVDWILLCPGTVESGSLSTKQAGRPTFYRRLIQDRSPPWLHRLPLAETSRGTAVLYEVERSGEAPPGGGGRR